MITMTVKGYDKLIAGLKSSESDIKNSMQKAINKIGLIAQRDIKSFTPVRTGRLQRGNQLMLGSLTAIISNNVEYGPYIHNGTKNMKGRPFMEWGVEKAMPEIQKILEDEVDSVLKAIIK